MVIGLLLTCFQTFFASLCVDFIWRCSQNTIGFVGSGNDSDSEVLRYDWRFYFSFSHNVIFTAAASQLIILSSTLCHFLKRVNHPSDLQNPQNPQNFLFFYKIHNNLLQQSPVPRKFSRTRLAKITSKRYCLCPCFIS